MGPLLDFLQLRDFAPSDLLVVLSLVVLEALLSCDNAVALAVVVRRLPREQQGRALRYGIVGAYAFLFLALVFATWIVRQWYLKFLGGAYLVWLAWKHFRQAGHHAEDATVPTATRRILGLSAFWSTVVMVELTDVAFSVDSIAAAVALSDKFWVLMLGGMLCIVAMRFVAQAFIALLHRFPGLETAAFLAVALIGIKLLIEFPLDVVGRQAAFPTEVAYADAAGYVAAAAQHNPPAVAVPHMVTINLSADPLPDAARFTAPREYQTALNHWILHGRGFIDIDEWGAAAIIPLIFLGGFFRRRPKETVADG